MPVYEYACEKCGHEFEAEQRITEDPLKTCPKCRARKLKRLISQTSFVLKGGGWYADLYASKSGKDTPAKSDAPAAKSDGASEGAPAAAAGGSDKAAAEPPPNSKGDGVKGDGAKGDGAKGEGTKGEGKRGKRKTPKAAA